MTAVPRPRVLLSVAVSADGRIDNAGPDRLILSGPEDLDRVDQRRAESDALLVGAGTLLADNPRLLVKSARRRARRVVEGKPASPLRAVITESGRLSASARIWAGGGVVVYTTDSGAEAMPPELGHVETVPLGRGIDLGLLLDDLGARGVGLLMVEGGSVVFSAFLRAGLADEIEMAVAPLIVGEKAAPAFLRPGCYPGAPSRRMTLAEVRAVGDVALVRYLMTPAGAKAAGA